jgi:transposase-like protein
MVPVGLRLGDTENSVVVKDLLADLVDRGLRFEHGILAVLDGSKALRKGVTKVFGDEALVQRCTLHKRRNVTDYLPQARRTAIDERLATIFANADAAAGLADARRLAAQLRADYPDAVGSLLEGLEEMFTVARLGITGGLRRSLTNTNCIESMISTARVVTGRVKKRGKRRHEETMDRDRHDRSPTLLPTRPRPHRNGQPRHPHQPRHQPCNTHQLHSRSCLSNTKDHHPTSTTRGTSSPYAFPRN